VTPEAVGVFVGDNADNQIIHNHIYELVLLGDLGGFGSGLWTRPGEQAMSSNTTTCMMSARGLLSDLAGIYTCSTPDSRIRFNLVRDVTRRDYGGWGIYPDEGSHDLLIQKNLVFRCQDGALFAHHNRNITAENNILAFNCAAQIERGGIGGFELTFRRNVVHFKEGQAVAATGVETAVAACACFEHNLYWNAAGKPVLFGTKTLAEWQTMGQDQNSLIADPLFVDPENGTFRLRPGSPAAQIGFEPWGLLNCGPPVGSRIAEVSSGFGSGTLIRGISP